MRTLDDDIWRAILYNYRQLLQRVERLGELIHHADAVSTHSPPVKELAEAEFEAIVTDIEACLKASGRTALRITFEFDKPLDIPLNVDDCVCLTITPTDME